MTDTVVALYGAHFHVIMPRQRRYLHRCWSGDELFATLCKIWLPGIRTLDLRLLLIIVSN